MKSNVRINGKWKRKVSNFIVEKYSTLLTFILYVEWLFCFNISKTEHWNCDVRGFTYFSHTSAVVRPFRAHVPPHSAMNSSKYDSCTPWLIIDLDSTSGVDLNPFNSMNEVSLMIYGKSTQSYRSFEGKWARVRYVDGSWELGECNSLAILHTIGRIHFREQI